MAERDIVVAEGLQRTFGSGASAVTAVAGIDLVVPRGQLAAIQGRSGSGKTTLLNLIGGLEEPDGGTVRVDGQDLAGMSEADRLRLRRRTVGFVFQSFGLVPILTAAENVGVPMRLEKLDPVAREQRVDLLLRLVGLAEHARQRPGELSGGQQQRVAIARALANEPPLIIADEPTGQLDSQTGLAVMTLLRALVRERGVTALVATHDPVLLDFADRVVTLRDGRVIGDEVSAARGPRDIRSTAPPDDPAPAG